MESNRDTDDLRKKVMKIMSWVAINKYGVDAIPNHFNGYIWKKVHSASEDVYNILKGIEKSTDEKIKILKNAAVKVYEQNPERFPAPGLFGLEVRNSVNFEKKQNNEVDSDFEKGRQLRMQRNNLIEKWEQKVTKEGVKKLEDRWLFLHGYPDLYVYRLDFWGNVLCQNDDAMVILNDYEKHV